MTGAAARARRGDTVRNGKNGKNGHSANGKDASGNTLVCDDGTQLEMFEDVPAIPPQPETE